ncbi:cytochrome P450 [Alterinioella nitratireducens]|uniref:cytochrome P450 n=1 Tax=Alterinioella nitratireducens TaxID=2735915 RepID=UPI001552854C|nr:cytochrome P450 [Alterinioella nitratireducens]NPD19649.1 cytochrome P450 [Alterinioella nitratireducens]
MSDAPIYEIDPEAFWSDPYPDLKRMRETVPIAYVPQLGATLITRRNDIFEQEKRVDVFSSVQPDGLMTLLMGQNMMRKDGDPHMAERRAIFPAISPKTVKDVWRAHFKVRTMVILDVLEERGECDLVADYAMPVSAEALKVLTGLTNMSYPEMDRVSQGLIDGCSNYAGDLEVEAYCKACTTSIDNHIDARMPALRANPDSSLLSVMMQAGLSSSQIRANIKLAISGGQNEPRDAIAGTAWALMTNPDQRWMIRDGKVTWLKAFEEYARWISPIGMSPRRVAREEVVNGVTFHPEDRVFLMFGSANRDADCFARPDDFDVTQDSSAAIPFGAGPHFCAGAWAARCLIADIALPMLFERLKGLRPADPKQTSFGGWAFRGPLKMPVVWDS